MPNITLEELVSLINGGGWQLRGGFRSKGVSPSPFITGAEIVEDVLVLRHDAEAVASVNIDRLTAYLTADDGRARQIVVNGPYMVHQQKKKVDGGGWHDVEHVGRQLFFVHAAAQAQHEADVAEKHRLAEQARKDAAQLAREQAEADAARHLAEYVSRQKERLKGLTFEDLCIHGDSVTVTFAGGIKLTVELHDREDAYDPSSEASLGISVGEELL